MALMENRKPYIIEGVHSEIEVSFDGGATWEEVRGADTFAYEAGERESSSVQTFEGVVSVLGQDSISDVEIQGPGYLPHLPIWEKLQNAKDDNADITCRVRSVDRSANNIVTSAATDLAQFATANDAEVTFADADEATVAARFTSGIVKVGHLLRITGDTRDRVITSVQTDREKVDGEAGRFKVEAMPAPDAITPVAAALYTIKHPRLQLLFAAGIKRVGSLSFGAGADGSWTSNLVLTPNNPLPIPTLV